MKMSRGEKLRGSSSEAEKTEKAGKENGKKEKYDQTNEEY